jgi:N-methylhydantoinase A/acetone carboxylase, beta subunit
MGVTRILVPKLASGLCAFGQIISDVKYNYMAPFPARLEGPETAEALAKTFAETEARGIADLEEDGFSRDRIAIRRTLDMRYTGQVHECTVEFSGAEIGPDAIPALREAFHRRHEELYTYSEPHSVVEVVNVESALYGLIEKPDATTVPPGTGAEGALKTRRPIVVSADGAATEAPIYDGAKLGGGDSVSGPAVIEEETTTILVLPGWTATLHESGVFVLEAA